MGLIESFISAPAIDFGRRERAAEPDLSFPWA